MPVPHGGAPPHPALRPVGTEWAPGLIAEWQGGVVPPPEQRPPPDPRTVPPRPFSPSEIHHWRDAVVDAGTRARRGGNARFAADEFATSASLYGDGARAAAAGADDAHLAHLFYTNRAAAHLPLQNFALALADAQRALDLRPLHVP
eukprot:gene45295-44579_t